MKPGREYGLALVVLGAGGATALFGLGQVWATTTAGSASVTGGLPAVTTSSSGAAEVPVAYALTWLALAGLLALVATEGRGRRLVASILSATTVAAVVSVITGRPVAGSTPGPDGVTTVVTTMWWLGPALGLTLAAVTFAVAAWRGGTWPGMSRRYERRAMGVDPLAAKSQWDAQDRGEDPTT